MLRQGIELTLIHRPFLHLKREYGHLSYQQISLFLQPLHPQFPTGLEVGLQLFAVPLVDMQQIVNTIVLESQNAVADLQLLQVFLVKPLPQDLSESPKSLNDYCCLFEPEWQDIRVPALCIRLDGLHLPEPTRVALCGLVYLSRELVVDPHGVLLVHAFKFKITVATQYQLSHLPSNGPYIRLPKQHQCLMVIQTIECVGLVTGCPFIIQINIFNMMTIPEVATQEISEEDIQKRRKIEQEVETILKEMSEQVQFLLSSGPHQDYFLGQQANKLKMKEMNAKYNNAIQSKLFMEIQTGKTKLNKSKMSYVIEPKPQQTLQQMIEKDKNLLRLKKKHAMQALSEVLRQENQLVKHQRSLKESRSFTKSQLYSFLPENPQWKSHLKLAIRRKRQLERSIQMRSEQAEKRAESLRQQQIKAKMQRLQRQKYDHIKLLEIRKQKQAIQTERSKQSKHKCKQFVHKTKPNKYRFKLMSERGEQDLRMKQQERNQKMKQYKQMKQRKYNWAELKQHESKYSQALNEKKEQWVKKFQGSISRVPKKHPKSVFAQRIQQEQNQRQFQARTSQNRKHEFLEKVREYSASVLQNHMPRKLIKSTNQLIKNDSKTVRHSLNRFQQRQRGLQYLGEAKKHRKLTQDIKNPSNLKPASSLPAIKAPAYKDYLRQQPKRAKQGTSFYTVLSQKKGEWAANAKSIIQRMDVTNKKSDHKLLDSAFKKIELLKAIM